LKQRAALPLVIVRQRVDAKASLDDRLRRTIQYSEVS
jgi:hypothetical protein